jgi:hypothetical protein
VCIDNAGYEASLERNKISVVVPDIDAERDGNLHVVDESGEDYLLAANRFVAIEVPAAVQASLLKAWQPPPPADDDWWDRACRSCAVWRT